jgi:hypothetical protein
VYGPVRTVVWEGWGREAPPYPDTGNWNILSYVSPIEIAFFTNLVRSIGRRVWIKRTPPRFSVDHPSFAYIHRGAVKNRLDTSFRDLGNADGKESPAAADSFGVDLRILLAHTCFCQSAQDAARNTACRGNSCRGGKPPGRDNRTDSWNCNHPEACEQASHPADRGAYTRPSRGTFSTVIDTVTVVVMLACWRRHACAGEPVVCIRGDDADVTGWNTNGFELAQNLSCGSVVIIETRQCDGHVHFSWF